MRRPEGPVRGLVRAAHGSEVTSARPPAGYGVRERCPRTLVVLSNRQRAEVMRPAYHGASKATHVTYRFGGHRTKPHRNFTSTNTQTSACNSNFDVNSTPVTVTSNGGNEPGGQQP